MKITYRPLLQIQREIYAIPRGMTRFERYVRTMSNETRSDRTGRFLLLLKDSSTSRRVLRIDGKPASRPQRRYGFFEYGLTVNGGHTNSFGKTDQSLAKSNGMAAMPVATCTAWVTR